MRSGPDRASNRFAGQRDNRTLSTARKLDPTAAATQWSGGDGSEAEIGVLRQKLQQMTEVMDVDQHPSLLAELTRDCPNSIRILASPHPIKRYTCLMHVFDFTERPEYVAIASHGVGRIYASPAFAHWLIAGGHLVEVAQDDALDGVLVFYFSEGSFKHVGLHGEDGRAVSKWGQGHLYDHALLEVPVVYGAEVRFYRGVPFEDAYDLLVQFAEENGMRFEPRSSDDAEAT